MDGDFDGKEGDRAAWGNPIFDQNDVACLSSGNQTPLPKLDNPVLVNAGETRSFYVLSPTNDIRYTTGSTYQGVYAQNVGEITFYEGKGSGGEFGGTFSPRIWNGIIEYGLADTGSTDEPTKFPTRFPTSLPTSQPSSLPSHAPSSNPSSQPTREPSSQPTSIPTTAQPSSVRDFTVYSSENCL